MNLPQVSGVELVPKSCEVNKKGYLHILGFKTDP